MNGLALAALACAGAGILYLVVATVMVLRRARQAVPDDARTSASVTLLKPLHGLEPELFENLSSFCRQDYGGPVEIVFGVQSPSDPAIAVVDEVRSAFPDLPIELVVDARLHGSNRKVSNLVNMSRSIRHDVVVLADSDMRVAPDYLARVVAALAAPGTGAVTCLYHGHPGESRWSQLSALSIDTHFLPSAVLGIDLGLAKPCFGSTIALRRDTLEAIGGFQRVADDLADDYALGAAVRGLGLEVAVPRFSVGHACPERGLHDLVHQELRWQRTVRQIEPAGHVGSTIAHPLAFAVLAFVIAPGALTLGAIGATLGARLALCLAVERAFGLRPHPYWLIPARDLLSFGLFVASFFGRRVTWRGHRYDVARDGILVSKAES